MFKSQQKRLLAQGAGCMIERVSMLTNTSSQRFIPLDADTFCEGFDAWRKGKLIQDCFPTLSAEDREFIKTGITPEQWDAMVASTEEE